jgi:hypothetical protein
MRLCAGVQTRLPHADRTRRRLLIPAARSCLSCRLSTPRAVVLPSLRRRLSGVYLSSLSSCWPRPNTLTHPQHRTATYSYAKQVFPAPLFPVYRLESLLQFCPSLLNCTLSHDFHADTSLAGRLPAAIDRCRCSRCSWQLHLPATPQRACLLCPLPDPGHQLNMSPGQPLGQHPRQR